MRFVLLWLATGCSALEVRATVRADEVLVAGASVSMFCPQVFKADGPSRFGVTDRHGRLVFREHPGGRWIHDNCELWVERDGFARYRVPVTDACEEWQANRCIRAVVVADLVRER